MIAAATLIVAVVREVMAWPSYEPAELAAHGIPVISGFHPMPHTSRKGWLARFDCYPKNPFACDIDRDMWQTEGHGELSLRGIAGHTVRHFWRSIRELSDPFTSRLIASVMRGQSPSLLELEDRPEEYEDVGKLCAWDEVAPPAQLGRSRYERVVIRAISGQRLRMNGQRLRPVGMSGWSAIVFQREDNRREVIAIDDLIGHLGEWERQ
jgi:hypothetical protein